MRVDIDKIFGFSLVYGWVGLGCASALLLLSGYFIELSFVVVGILLIIFRALYTC